MAHKKWVLRKADKLRASEISTKFDIDPFIAFLMLARGIDDDLAVSSFLAESLEAVSPFRFEDMEAAALTVAEALDAGERICIYGDYDCDGVTATALLMQFLQREGGDVFYYIPSRHTEGYGLNNDAIDKIREQGASLIVTVDNGISSVSEAQHIYDLGMRLVITDHHQLGDELPMAEAVVNPHRPENDLSFRDYCGVAVAFKLICAIYDGDVQDLVNEYIDLVALGTIADVVPLLEENRFFVKAGLDKIRFRPRTAIRVFCEENKRTDYTANDIAFQLCPKINAVGRMDDASVAVEYLLEEDYMKCRGLYLKLADSNTERQNFERDILEDVTKQLEKNPRLTAGRVIVVSGVGYHQGVVGIVASHIVEQYGKPAVIIGTFDGEGRGSARSVEGFNIYEAIAACSEDLIRFGGHPLAAGVTLSANNIDAFRKHINEYALRRYPQPIAPELTLDCRISPKYLGLPLVENLKLLEPYGASNPPAVFGVYKMTIVSITPLSEGKHVKMELEKKGDTIRVVRFGTPFEQFPYHVGDVVDCAIKVSKNIYKERAYLSIQAVDMRMSFTDDERFFREKNDFEMYRLTGRLQPYMYPTRDDCAALYRFLKKNGGWQGDRESLCLRMQESLNYSAVMFALAAFAQTGLVSIDGGITLNPPQGKTDLEAAPILKTLRERLNIG